MWLKEGWDKPFQNASVDTVLDSYGLTIFQSGTVGVEDDDGAEHEHHLLVRPPFLLERRVESANAISY